MTRPLICLVGIIALLAIDAVAQFPGDGITGQFYRLEPPIAAPRSFDAVLIERVAPSVLAYPPPVTPLPLPSPIRGFGGQPIELPDRQRIYFTALDPRGLARLFEVDLLTRQTRQVSPPPGISPPLGARVLAAPRGAKLYVAWLRPSDPYETDIYSGESLDWLGSTREFRADERAAGFEHLHPYMWTLDAVGRPVLVDTHRDMVVNTFDLQRWFGPIVGVTADAWRDLLLFRLDVGNDRFQIVDVVSGEIGPALDLEEYRLATARLILGGRYLALIDMERRAPAIRFERWRETAIATGGGAIYDLRSGDRVADFHLAVPFDLPVAAVGAHDDETAAGRVWIHVPGDAQRFDLEAPSCDRRPGAGADIEGQVEVVWDAAEDPLLYRYTVRAAPSSARAAAALAVKAGRETDRTAAPAGWGIDLIDGERWVRWSNGLGPTSEDIAPGETGRGFVLAAEQNTRPGIVEYRLQASVGMPRSCQSESAFLSASRPGFTLAPETVDSGDPDELSGRLEDLVGRACEIGWIGPQDCPGLEAAAEETRRDDAAVAEFLRRLRTSGATASAVTVLSDAAGAIRESRGDRP